MENTSPAPAAAPASGAFANPATMLRSIVVGIDFTPASCAALEQGARMAAWNRGRLHVVHAVEPLPFIPADPLGMGGWVPQMVDDDLLFDARRAWESFALACPGRADLVLDLSIGNPLMVLTDRMNAHAADILILGTHGATHPDEPVGTLAAAAVRRAPAPVLLVREDKTGPFRTVVACVDFSANSRLALEHAVRIAVQDSAELHVIHVFESPLRRLRHREDLLRTMPDFHERYRAGVCDRLRAFAAPLQAEVAWLRPAFHAVEHATHGAGIAEFIQAHHGDLVVLGTRGHTNLRDLVMGSTAERVVRDATCSVLAIKPG